MARSFSPFLFPCLGCIGWCSLALAPFACGSAPAPAGFGAQPYVTVMSQTKHFSVAVRTDPQPPTRGDQSVEFTIADATTGAAETGLALNVVPWMPVMGHGTSVVPSVAEPSPGVYRIANVDLFMAGLWALKTTISAPADRSDSGADAAPAAVGVLGDYVEPSFQIP